MNSMAPKLRFKQFSDEWKNQQFNDVFERITRKNKENNRNILTISAQEGLVNQERYFSKLVAAKDVTGYYLLHENNYAYNKSYSKGYPMGAIKRLIDQQRGVVSTLYICFVSKCKTELFFDQYFEAGKLNTEIEKIAQEGARNHGLLNISVTDFFKMALTIPTTIEEMQKIAEFLTGVDERIKLHGKKLKSLQKYKRGIMQRIFSQQIRFKDENGRDYSDWQEKKLSEVSTIVKGQQRNKVTLTNYSKYPVINGGISPSGFTDDWNEEANTITVSEGGNSCGYVNLIKSKFWSGGHCYSLLVEKNVNNFFLYQYLKYIQLEIMRLRVGSGLPNIQKNDIYKLKLYLPVEEEQQKIAEFLTSFDDRIELERSYLEQAKQFKKALLQRMFV